MVEPAREQKEIGARVLALCGENLLIAGIEASLRDREGVEIVQFDTFRPGAAQDLDALNPDIIVFDLVPSQLSSVLTFLRTHTDAVFIGLEIESDLALVLSGEWRMLPTVADLMQVIEAQIQAKDS